MTQSTEASWRHIVCAAGSLSAVILAANMNAQTGTRSSAASVPDPSKEARVYTVGKVEITFGPGCTIPRGARVYLVLNGIDTEIEMERDGNRWIATGTPKIDPDDATASARFDKKRTDCQPTKRANDRKEPNRYVAQLHFSLCVDAVQRVTIGTERPIDVSYVREFLTCRERRAFFGAHPVSQLSLPTEKIRLQLGAKRPNPNGLGLKVNPLLEGRDKKQNSRTVGRAGVIQALIVQRARGDGSAPNFSTTAIDIDVGKLKNAGLERLVLTVE